MFPVFDEFIISFGRVFALHDKKKKLELTMEPTTEAMTTDTAAPRLGSDHLTVTRSESSDTTAGAAAPGRMGLTGVLAMGIEEANSDDDRKLKAAESDDDEEMDDVESMDSEDDDYEDKSGEEEEEEEEDDEEMSTGNQEDDNGPFPAPAPVPGLAPLGPAQALPPHMQARNLASPPQRPGVAGYGHLTSPSGSLVAMPNVPSPAGETLSSQTDANLAEAGDSVRNMDANQQHAVLFRCHRHINRLEERALAQFQAMAPTDAAARQLRESQMVTALRRAVGMADTPKWLTRPHTFNDDFGLFKHEMHFARVNTATHTSDKKALAHGRLYETESAANYWSACFIRAYVEHGMDVGTSRAIANAHLQNLIAKKYGLVGSVVNHTFPN